MSWELGVGSWEHEGDKTIGRKVERLRSDSKLPTPISKLPTFYLPFTTRTR